MTVPDKIIYPKGESACPSGKAFENEDAVIQNPKIGNPKSKNWIDFALRIIMFMIMVSNSLTVYCLLPDVQYSSAFKNPEAICPGILTFESNQTSNNEMKVFKDSHYEYFDLYSESMPVNLKLIAGFGEESNDTINEPEKNDYFNSLKNDRLTGSRTSRWYFAWGIFKKYPLYKKIFGGGFDYLKLFGEEFNEAKEDYPHNPFISAFLYSGLIGGFVYIIFIVSVLILYIKYYRRHLFFLICFFIVFFFSFVSANSHFSVPVFAILSLIPFLTRHLVKKERISSSRNP